MNPIQLSDEEFNAIVHVHGLKISNDADCLIDGSSDLSREECGKRCSSIIEEAKRIAEICGVAETESRVDVTQQADEVWKMVAEANEKGWDCKVENAPETPRGDVDTWFCSKCKQDGIRQNQIFFDRGNDKDTYHLGCNGLLLPVSLKYKPEDKPKAKAAPEPERKPSGNWRFSDAHGCMWKRDANGESDIHAEVHCQSTGEFFWGLFRGITAKECQIGFGVSLIAAQLAAEDALARLESEAKQ